MTEGKDLDERNEAASVGNTSLGKPAGGGNRWTFLTNHSHVLVLLHANPGVVLREVAARIGITERAVQRIVQDLEEEGFVRREKVGRRNRYEVLTEQSLRHPIEAHRKIGDLLSLVAPVDEDESESASDWERAGDVGG
ncbi:MAG: MarR family transcriptional regulator [Planctomycetota bacterium]